MRCSTPEEQRRLSRLFECAGWRLTRLKAVVRTSVACGNVSKGLWSMWLVGRFALASA